jgi:beta-galactosidase/beta-glucuronidase
VLPRNLHLKKTVLALCAAMMAVPLVLPASAPAAVPSAGALYTNGPSGRFLLDGSWLRRADPRDRGIRNGFPRSRSTGGWKQITVPDAANAADMSARSYLGGVYWYRKDFESPGGAATNWVLRFESVNFRATVWLNGRRLGRHTGGYLPFELEAKGVRRGTNRLVVRVDSRRTEQAIPPLGVRSGGKYVGGWWNYAGILREVYLRRVDTFDFVNVVARPRLDCPDCDARVYLRAVVANMEGVPARAEVSATVGGQRIRFTPATIQARGFRLFRGSTAISSPRLWSPEDPHLYDVELTVSLDGQVVQHYTLKTGIRSIVRDEQGRMLLNGRHLKLRGASLHEEDATRGAALLPDDIRANFALLRDLGANMTRSHYPMHPLALELADRYGIVVWSEVPVYQMRDQLFRSAAVRHRAVQAVRDMVNRDRSHPSVIVWSLGNENTSKPGQGFNRYVGEATRLVRRLDSTRLVGLAFPGYPTVGKVPLYTRIDALGINDYFGWYGGPQGSISDRSALSPYLERLHDDYPRQAIFITEFGAEANRSGSPTEKGTFQFQSDFLSFHLGVFGQKDYLNGALVWILRDFRVKPGYDGGNPQPRPPYNTKGLVDETGARKPSFEAVKLLFRGGP